MKIHYSINNEILSSTTEKNLLNKKTTQSSNNSRSITCISELPFDISNQVDVINLDEGESAHEGNLILCLPSYNNETIGRFLLKKIFVNHNINFELSGEVIGQNISKSTRSSLLFEGMIRLLIKRANFRGLNHVFHLLSEDESQEYLNIYHKLGFLTHLDIISPQLVLLLVQTAPRILSIIENEITYEFTSNPCLLEQYYVLREKSYRERLGVQFFSGGEEEYDRIGHVIVAHRNGLVVGGARLVVSLPDKRIQLPLEDKNFILNDLFPEFHLDKTGYCEITRMAVSDNFRQGTINFELTRLLIIRAIEENCHYHFSIAPLAQARNSRKIFNCMGASHVIQHHIKVPTRETYEHYKVCLSVTYLKSFIR